MVIKFKENTIFGFRSLLLLMKCKSFGNFFKPKPFVPHRSVQPPIAMKGNQNESKKSILLLVLRIFTLLYLIELVNRDILLLVLPKS